MSLIGLLADRLTPEAFRRLSEAIGTDETTTRKAIAGGFVMLFGLTARNLTSDVAANELHRSVRAGYDARLLERLPEYFAAGPSTEEAGAADDLMGNVKTDILTSFAGEFGLDPPAADRLLSLLVPVVMSALATRQQEADLDAESLADEIVRERREMWQKEPQAMQRLRRLLEEDSDLDRVLEAGIRSLD